VVVPEELVRGDGFLLAQRRVEEGLLIPFGARGGIGGEVLLQRLDGARGRDVLAAPGARP